MATLVRHPQVGKNYETSITMANGKLAIGVPKLNKIVIDDIDTLVDASVLEDGEHNDHYAATIVNAPKADVLYETVSEFGYAVQFILDGEYLLVGSPGSGPHHMARCGVVYAYKRDDNAQYTMLKHLIPSGPDIANAGVGRDIVVNGDIVLLVGNKGLIWEHTLEEVISV